MYYSFTMHVRAQTQGRRTEQGATVPLALRQCPKDFKQTFFLIFSC